MNKPILVANWKNHPSSSKEALALLKKLKKDALHYKKIKTFIAPPATYFEGSSQIIKGFAGLASQNISSLDSGTHTGEVTPDILKSFGLRLSILGHSEQRALGEDSISVARKIKIAQKAGITALVCVGEKERDVDGEHFEGLKQEIRESLAGLKKESVKELVLAYEPIWAIGKKAKDAMSSQDLAQTVLFIKKVLTDMFGREVAEQVPVLYGGSVESSNAAILYKEGGVAGFLVGHASLDAKNFKAIAESLISKK
jgi:triosephosphate isomerase (TIM)